MDRAFLSTWLVVAREEDIQRGFLTCPRSHSKEGAFVLLSVPDRTRHCLKASHLPVPDYGEQRGAEAVNSFEPPHPCPGEMKNCQRQKEMGKSA